MLFMIQRKADANTENNHMPSNALLLEMAAYHEEMVKAGVLVDGHGLKSSEFGARVRFAEGKPVVNEGPFADPQQLLAGFTLIRTQSREEALEWVKRWPKGDHSEDLVLELRQLFELEDFQPGTGIDKTHEVFLRSQRQPANLSPYLMFNGNCQEAFAFYADCLGGEINMQVLHKANPDSASIPAGWEDKIMHCCLQAGQWYLMGCDAPPDCHPAPTSDQARGFSLSITLEQADAAAQTFNQLAAGGQILMPYTETFWAQRFGMLTDRFGIDWMITHGLKDCPPN